MSAERKRYAVEPFTPAEDGCPSGTAGESVTAAASDTVLSRAGGRPLTSPSRQAPRSPVRVLVSLDELDRARAAERAAVLEGERRIAEQGQELARLSRELCGVHLALAEADIPRAAGVDEPLYSEQHRVRLLRERAEQAERQRDEWKNLADNHLVERQNADHLREQAERLAEWWLREHAALTRTLETCEQRAEELERALRQVWNLAQTDVAIRRVVDQALRRTAG